MARVEIRPQYVPFARDLEQICREREVTLSPHAQALLQLSAESWLEDSTLARERGMDQATLRDVADRILREALEDPHVRDARRRGLDVSFDAWLVAIGDAGKRVVRPLLDKGF